VGDAAIASGAAAGFEAGIYRFNKAGGLDGRKIEFTGFLDDAFSPQTNLTETQQLVQDKHVLAVAPMISQVATAATGTYLAGAKVPFIGYSINAAFETQPKWGFGINGNQGNPEVQGTAGMVQLVKAMNDAKTPGKVKMALIAENVPGGIVANNALAGVAKYVGIDVVYVKAPIAVEGTTNYAPYAQAIISSGANAVYEVLASGDSIGLAAALKAGGYEGTVTNGVTYFPGQLSSQPNEEAALNGVYVENEFPANQNATPAVRQAEKDLEAIGQKPSLTTGTSQGYWSAIVLEQMLKATLKRVGGNPDKVTGAALQQTVVGGFSYIQPIAGGIGNEYFPAAETIPTGCGTLVQTVGSGFKQVAPFQCLGAVNVKTKKIINQKTGRPA
jgi:ABC-type branched-subunit amino acid transport system substrate-binding protein